MSESQELDADRGPERSGELLAGKYRIVRWIGAGGMGQVYEAEHATVGRRFAVKFLRAHLASSESALARFRREARAAGALESEHIAAVVDFDVAPDGAPFIVMEYLEGRTLGQLLLDEGPLPLSRAASAMVQVCRGLEVAHAAGILHRDLKPDNLFLVRGADGSERVKIVDFGVAKLLHGAADTAPINTGAAIGTPFYMAPEQARGDKNLDVRVDVYAVGVILYELLSGEKPHPGDSANAALAHVLTEPAARLDSLRAGLPPALVELVHRALSFEPKQRPESARALGQELESFLAPEVRRVRSQFELRTASTLADAATPQASPTPAAEPAQPAQDSQSLAVAAAPERGNASPASPAKRVLLLAGILGLAAFAWFRFSAPPSADSEPRTEPSAAPDAFASRNEAESAAASSAARAGNTLPSADAATPLEPAAKAQDAAPAGSAGRPRGRPRSVPRAPGATEQAPPVDLMPSPPKSISTGVSAGATASSRVRFDAQNPYD